MPVSDTLAGPLWGGEMNSDSSAGVRAGAPFGLAHTDQPYPETEKYVTDNQAQQRGYKPEEAWLVFNKRYCFCV